MVLRVRVVIELILSDAEVWGNFLRVMSTQASLSRASQFPSLFAVDCREDAVNSGNGRLETSGLKQCLQLFTAAAAKFQFGSILKQDDIVAVEVLLQFADSLDVDDRRAMDSQKL